MNVDSRNNQRHYRKTSDSFIDNKNETSQQTCDRNFQENSLQHNSLQKASLQYSLSQNKQLNKQLDFNQGPVVDFSVIESGLRGIHFMNACCDTPSVYSRALDCFLETDFRLLASFLRDISHCDQCSNVFEITTRINLIYEAAIASSDTTLLSQVSNLFGPPSYQVKHLLFHETVFQNFHKYLQEIFLLDSPIKNNHSLKLLTQQVVHAYDVVELMKETQQSFFDMFLKQNWLSVTM